MTYFGLKWDIDFENRTVDRIKNAVNYPLSRPTSTWQVTPLITSGMVFVGRPLTGVMDTGTPSLVSKEL